MEKYDFLVVGAGLYGAVFSREVTDMGKKCLVIDKRHHIGGNLYCENINGINVHKYGPHIFHTDNKEIWDYVNKYVSFNHFIYSPIACHQGRFYNLPFNMNTFYQLWGIKTPKEAQNKINQEREPYRNITNPKNLEEQALKLVGQDIYLKLIKGYTEKQWGRPAKELPAFIIRRLPVRFNFDNNYFNHPYQGIPNGGYNLLIKRLFSGIEVRTNTNFFENRPFFENIAKQIVYTGKIDEFYNNQFGKLEYRSLRFETTEIDTNNFQGIAGINYTDTDVPFTRIIEHKHFEFGNQPTTVITKEYPNEFSLDKEPYYPINDDKNQQIFKRYKEYSEKNKKAIFGGRLAEYKYYDMHHIVHNALLKSKKNEFKNSSSGSNI